MMEAYGPGHGITWEVGNEVIVCKPSNRDDDTLVLGVILKVGRKYATIEFDAYGNGRKVEAQFVMADGYEKPDRDMSRTDWSRSVYRDRQAVENYEELKAARTECHKKMRNLRWHQMTPEQVFALHAVLAEIS